jgi:hypothetical protein
MIVVKRGVQKKAKKNRFKQGGLFNADVLVSQYSESY